MSNSGGTWVAQLVKSPTSAQVVISQFMNLSPTSGSMLTAQSLEPASDSVSPSLSAPSPLTLCLSVSQIQINILKKEEEEEEIRYLNSGAYHRAWHLVGAQ